MSVPRSHRETVLGALVLAVAFAALTAWSWLQWTDWQVDFGVELYVPWRLTEGEALYRDVATRNGPLSHYVNALVFAALPGPSLRGLIVCNLAILAAICAMSWKLFRDGCGPLTATICTGVLLVGFGFSQYTRLGNFNYVTPYQHPQTHALALSIAMMLACVRGLRGGGPGSFGIAGVCLGLVLLTKAEWIVPAVAVALTSLGLLVVGRRPALRSAGALGVGAAVPVAAMTAFLASQMPLELALRGVLGNFGYVGADLARDPFYLRTMGLDDLPGNTWAAVKSFGAVAAFALFAAAIDALVPRRFARHAGAVAGAGWVAAGLLVALPLPWFSLARALPLSTLATALALGAVSLRALRARDQREPAPREIGLLLWSIFALLLLGKVMLNARFGHYGFALAMPATLLLVAAIVDLLPRALSARVGRGDARLGRALGIAAVAACSLALFTAADTHYAGKNVSIGARGDRILVDADDPRTPIVAGAMARLDTLLAEDATLLVWPEGVMLNYWLRRENPSRYNLFLPSELDAFGADRVLADVKRSRPDWVVLLHRDATDFGGDAFGTTPATGRDFIEWFDAHYARVEQLGAEPFTGRGPGLVILRRR